MLRGNSPSCNLYWRYSACVIHFYSAMNNLEGNVFHFLLCGWFGEFQGVVALPGDSRKKPWKPMRYEPNHTLSSDIAAKEPANT